jgi:hypothetical protein
VQDSHEYNAIHHGSNPSSRMRSLGRLDNTPRVVARILDAIKFLVLCFFIAVIIDKIGIWPIY